MYLSIGVVGDLDVRVLLMGMHESVKILFRQQLFQLLLLVLVIVSLALGLLVIPIERREKDALIVNPETGIWWAVTTITGVGYGDVVPVTQTGRIIGMALEVTGVLAFGLLVALMAAAIERREERWYWNRLWERLHTIEGKLHQLEKKEEFTIKKDVK